MNMSSIGATTRCCPQFAPTSRGTYPGFYPSLLKVPPFVVTPNLPLGTGTGGTSGRFSAKVFH